VIIQRTFAGKHKKYGSSSGRAGNVGAAGGYASTPNCHKKSASAGSRGHVAQISVWKHSTRPTARSSAPPSGVGELGVGVIGQPLGASDQPGRQRRAALGCRPSAALGRQGAQRLRGGYEASRCNRQIRKVNHNLPSTV
jgi:hypothetical protein